MNLTVAYGKQALWIWGPPKKKKKKNIQIPFEFPPPSGIYWISQLDNNNINLKNSSSDPGVSAASQYLSQDAVEVLVASTHSTRSYDHICLGTKKTSRPSRQVGLGSSK
jgi:hypothetical protein